MGLSLLDFKEAKMDRPIKPYGEVKEMLGASSIAWEKLVGHIRFYYEMDEDWREGKPTQKHRNNIFFKRSGKSFAIVSLREGYFIMGIVFGKAEREKFEEKRAEFSDAILKEYDAAEVLHDGKWMVFEMYDDTLVDDIIKMLHIKRKPNRKVLPQSMDKCEMLDIGMAHGDITAKIMSN